MGTGEESTTPKPSKQASSSQEVPTTPSYHDWPSPMKAYYGAGAAPPFFASTVASPTPPPYIWGGQHHLIPPYGTPVPYPAIYPPGAVYAHPNMATTVVPTQATAELEGKGADVKDGLSAKKSKGNLGNSVAKTGDGIKATSGSGNDGTSQSGESGSEGSSDGNEDHNQQDYASNKKGSFDQMLVDGANAQNNSAGGNIPVSVTGKPIGTAPATTNLNIGMDLWNPSTAAGVTKMRPNPAGAAGAIVPAGMMTDQWIQDERELKRQRRKQSNRESARRSRLRKQAECEELQARVENLSNENRTLRDELQRLSEECEKLTSENSSIKEELTRLCGPEALANLEQDSNSVTESHQNEGDS